MIDLWWSGGHAANRNSAVLDCLTANIGLRILSLNLVAAVFLAASRLFRVIQMGPDGCWLASIFRG